MTELPEVFLARLENIYSPDIAKNLIASFNQEKDISFRINPLIAKCENEVIGTLKQSGISTTKLDLYPHTYICPAQDRYNLTHNKLYAQGYFYIQNLSSMLPAIILNPSKHERILDLAAAPGSKTTQMAVMMQNEGWISAVEINKNRFFKLLDNLKRQNINNVHTYLMDGADVWKKCPEQFDKILVDAPCSSESRINIHNPDSYSYWSEKKIKEMCKKQKRLLFSAVLSLRPGGTLLYSTCSFAPEENELAITKLLKKFGHLLSIEPIEVPTNNWLPGIKTWKNKIIHPDLRFSKRILPTASMDGFFICKLRKTGSSILGTEFK